MKEPIYPNVRCGRPGHSDRPGFLICTHVMFESAPVEHLKMPSAQRIGEILCGLPTHNPDHLKLCCWYCAKDRGWVTPVQ